MELPFSLETANDDPHPDRAQGLTGSLVYYSDANADLGLITNALPVVTDADAIGQQILQVLLTPIGSEEFEPTFGSNLPFMLFEPNNAESLTNLELGARQALSKWLGSRLIFTNISASADKNAGNVYVSIDYTVKYNGAKFTFNGPVRRIQ